MRRGRASKDIFSNTAIPSFVRSVCKLYDSRGLTIVSAA